MAGSALSGYQKPGRVKRRVEHQSGERVVKKDPEGASVVLRRIDTRVFDLDPEIENLEIEMHFAAKQRVRVGYERLRAVARTCLSEISDTRDAKMYPPPLFDRHATATHRGGVVVKACDPQEAVKFLFCNVAVLSVCW